MNTARQAGKYGRKKKRSCAQDRSKYKISDPAGMGEPTQSGKRQALEQGATTPTNQSCRDQNRAMTWYEPPVSVGELQGGNAKRDRKTLKQKSICDPHQENES